MFLGLLNRSNSYNGLQSTQSQPRVISGKQRNTSGSSLLYQVNIHLNRIFSNQFAFRNLVMEI
jgi:hypothetical protein